MNRRFKILTILGSPHDRKSNTRALVDDFVEKVAEAGLSGGGSVVAAGRLVQRPGETHASRRILVAGATGYLGGFVAREFKSRGWFVRALVRSTGTMVN